MNSTFKVVFNKARGTLMVANELTSSVQKKGGSLVVATAATLASVILSAFASSAIAANSFGTITIDNATADASKLNNEANGVVQIVGNSQRAIKSIGTGSTVGLRGQNIYLDAASG